MAEKKKNTWILEIEEEEEQACLIALYSSREIFRIAYQLNRVLGINLKREEKDIDFIKDETISLFPLYRFYDEESLAEYFFVPNRATKQTATMVDQGPLFHKQDNQYNYYAYLVPELKRVDYFFKIEGTDEASDFIDKIKTIKQVSAVFPVEKSSLKSYINLIFD